MFQFFKLESNLILSIYELVNYFFIFCIQYNIYIIMIKLVDKWV